MEGRNAGGAIAHRDPPGCASFRIEPAGGFSLIETLVALLLLATVLGAVAALFVQGGRVVAGSRSLTQATRLADRILEPIRSWPYSALYSSFGKTAADSGFEVESLTNSRARLWQPEIEASLPGGRARIQVDPLGGATFGTSKGVRIRVTIEWMSGPERAGVRSVTLVAVRF